MEFSKYTCPLNEYIPYKRYNSFFMAILYENAFYLLLPGSHPPRDCKVFHVSFNL